MVGENGREAFGGTGREGGEQYFTPALAQGGDMIAHGLEDVNTFRLSLGGETAPLAAFQVDDRSCG